LACMEILEPWMPSPLPYIGFFILLSISL
jgi:hypothetical protein